MDRVLCFLFPEKVICRVANERGSGVQRCCGWQCALAAWKHRGAAARARANQVGHPPVGSPAVPGCLAVLAAAECPAFPGWA